MKTKIDVSYDIDDIFIYFEGKHIPLLDIMEYMISNDIELKKGMGVTLQFDEYKNYGFDIKQKHGGYTEVLDNNLFNAIYEWLEDNL